MAGHTTETVIDSSVALKWFNEEENTYALFGKVQTIWSLPR